MSDDTARTRMEVLYRDVLGDVAELMDRAESLKNQFDLSLVAIDGLLSEQGSERLKLETAIRDMIDQQVKYLCDVQLESIYTECMRSKQDLVPQLAQTLEPKLAELADSLRVLTDNVLMTRLKVEKIAEEQKNAPQPKMGRMLLLAFLGLSVVVVGTSWFIPNHPPISVEDRRRIDLSRRIENNIGDAPAVVQKWVGQMGK